MRMARPELDAGLAIVSDYAIIGPNINRCTPISERPRSVAEPL